MAFCGETLNSNSHRNMSSINTDMLFSLQETDSFGGLDNAKECAPPSSAQ